MPGFSGTIEGGETPSISGTVDASTITTFDETRDGHMQSPDFFDTERYPELRFESTSVETRGDELVVDGELTIKGVTKPVAADGPLRRSGRRPVGQRPHRPRARRHDRSHRVRARSGTHRSPAAASSSRTRSSSRPTSRRSRRPEVKVLAISGSLRAGSYNTALARAAVELAPAGVEIELYDGLGLLPHYDAGPRPGRRRDAVLPSRTSARRIDEADALFVVTPEYNGSTTGVLKNAHRLGLGPASRKLAPEQDRRDRRRDDGRVRRDLGAAGSAAHTRHRRRPRRRGRVPASPGRTRRSTSPERCRARSSPSASAPTSPRSCTRPRLSLSLLEPPRFARHRMPRPRSGRLQGSARPEIRRSGFRSTQERRGAAPGAAPRDGYQRWISRGASGTCVSNETTRSASREPPTLARRFPVVPGARLYPLVPPLPVLSSLKPDHLLSAVVPAYAPRADGGRAMKRRVPGIVG